mgnify:CR=1 FL=1
MPFEESSGGRGGAAPRAGPRESRWAPGRLNPIRPYDEPSPFRLAPAAPRAILRAKHFPMLNRASTTCIALSAAALLSACGDPASRLAERPARPDVVLIFVDDLGYADLGCQGSPDIRTPHIDRIAANGVRFTDGYVTAPQCSPSRAGLVTGRHNARFGHEANAESAHQRAFGLATDQVAIGDAMQAMGYRTALVGEWDLGRIPSAHPLDRGFHEFHGFFGASRPYLPGSKDPAHILHDGRDIAAIETSGEAYFLTDVLTDRAIDFLERDADQPQFLYLAYHAPHWPLQAPAADLARSDHIEEPNRRAFAAIMSVLDDNVGRVLDYLQDSGRADSTLVFFISDNGGPTGTIAEDGSLAFGQTTSRNDPFRGVKGQLYEGGIRVPFLAQWPGVIKPGRVDSTVVSTMDMMPTLVSVAGGKLDPTFPTDGLDLLPLLRGKRIDDRPLYFRWMGQKASRDGNWKYHQAPNGLPELYDLSADPAESSNLATSEPEVLARLMADWTRWNASNTFPMWRTPQQVEMMRQSYVNGMEMHPGY